MFEELLWAFIAGVAMFLARVAMTFALWSLALKKYWERRNGR